MGTGSHAATRYTYRGHRLVPELREADEATSKWRASPAPESKEALADALDQLIHALHEHMRLWEQRILLTEAERRVLRYLPTHLSAREIATGLSCSVHTVRTHMRHVYAKLGASSRTEAVMRARALGMLAPTPGSAERPRESLG